MSFAEQLNKAKIVPDFNLCDNIGRAVDFSEVGVVELGTYSQYPLSDAKIYVSSVNGQEAQWTDNGWIDTTSQ